MIALFRSNGSPRSPARFRVSYGSHYLDDQPLYRLPFVPFSSILLAFPQLGAGRGALDVFLEKMHSRGIQYTSYTKQAEAPVTHLQVAEASAKLDAAEAVIDRAMSGSSMLHMPMVAPWNSTPAPRCGATPAWPRN